MAEQELGGNIILSGFNIDSGELIIVKKIIGKYGEKIRNVKDYKELKVGLKVHIGPKKTENQKFEFKVRVLFDGDEVFAESQGLNIFVALDEVLKKILNETEHKIKND